MHSRKSRVSRKAYKARLGELISKKERQSLFDTVKSKQLLIKKPVKRKKQLIKQTAKLGRKKSKKETIIEKAKKAESMGLKSYMRKINKIEIPSFEQDIAWGRQIDLKRDALQGRLKDKRKKILKIIKFKGSLAQRKLVEGHLRFARFLTNRYFNKYGSFMEFEDMIQFANLGLVEAASRYSSKFNKKFTTYAGSWIKQSILRGLVKQGLTTPLPHSVFQELGKLRSIINSIEAKTMSKKEIKAKLESQLSGKKKIQADRFESLLDALGLQNPISIYKKVKEGEDVELYQFIPYGELPEKKVIEQDFMKRFWHYVNSLPQAQRTVLQQRYGTSKVVSFERIGKRKKLTRQGIRQIEVKAIKALLNKPSFRKEFSIFFPGFEKRWLEKTKLKLNK